jgi:hypothetical protein
MTLQVGQELVVPVRNGTGTAIANGTVVMAVGTLGASGRILIDEHDGTRTNAMRILGLATHTIAAGADGLVTSYGKVRGIDTTGAAVGESWAAGDILYLKPNDQGKLTKVKPALGNLQMPIAFVLYKSATQGLIEVRMNGIDENKYGLAAEVGVVPQGRLSSTTVQSALEELQADIDKVLVDTEW